MFKGFDRPTTTSKSKSLNAIFGMCVSCDLELHGRNTVVGGRSKEAELGPSRIYIWGTHVQTKKKASRTTGNH